MKITLVFPPFYLKSLYNLPPLGLLNLATILREAGHIVSVIDLVLSVRLKTVSMGPSIYEDSASMILREDPDLVAFSAQCTTFPFPNVPVFQSRRFTHRLASRPSRQPCRGGRGAGHG